jgi:hypothetical protein
MAGEWAVHLAAGMVA